jgi:type I restriction enzyme S subunit
MIPWIKPDDLDRAIYVKTSDEYLSDEGGHQARLIPAGSVLVSCIGKLGKLAIAATSVATNQQINAVVPRGDVDSVYLYYACRMMKSRLEAAASRSLVPIVNKSAFSSLYIPLPPLSEQRRIAAILRERLAAVEQARAAAAAQLAAAQALPAAYLRTVFESDEAQAWPRVRLGDTAKVQSGYAFKSEWFVDDGIRLLRNANIFQDYISWEDQVCLPYERRGEFSAFELCDGDIVLSLDRPLVSNGLKIARISQQDLPCLLLQRVARFQIHDDLDVDFLYTFLHTDAFITAITQHDQSLGVPHVSPKQVETILIPYPPVAEQRRIAADLHDRLVEVERVSMNLQEQLEEIVALPQALLRQAFAGEL